MPPHAQQFAGNPDGSLSERNEFDTSRRNFLALVFCLMVGTAALPHILMRYYLVVAFHCLALPHCAGLGGTGEVRGVHLGGGHAVQSIARVDHGVEQS
jgi:hypothetical protein